MAWWYWLLLGLVLIAAEVVMPADFYVIFFGLAALAVGALAGWDLVEAEWLQWLLFSLLSIVSLFVFRGPLLTRLRIHEPTGPGVDTLVGEVAVVLEDLAPGRVGKAELRGSTWNARNGGSVGLLRGQRARVERVEGLMLWIRAEQAS